MFLAACRKSWLSCAKGHTHRLTVSTAASCHYGCYDKTSANLPLKNTTSQLRWLQRLKTRCWSSSPLSCRPDLDLHREVCQRSDPLFSVICRSKLSKHHCRLPSNSLSLCGTNGFCTEASKKPVLEEKSSEKDSREKGEDQAASSPAANEGHFQFNELVSESGLLFTLLHAFHTCFDLESK